MKCHVATLLTAILVWTQAPARCAGGQKPETQMQVSWQDLPAVIGDKKIMMVMPDGADLRGHVLAVEPSQLVLDITKTSDKQTHPKGRTAIPRASVTTLSFTRTRTFWKVVDTAIGLGAGLAIAVPVNAYANNEGDGAPAAVAAIIAVPAAVGYLVGRSSDRKTVTIRVKD